MKYATMGRSAPHFASMAPPMEPMPTGYYPQAVPGSTGRGRRRC